MGVRFAFRLERRFMLRRLAVLCLLGGISSLGVAAVRFVTRPGSERALASARLTPSPTAGRPSPSPSARPAAADNPIVAENRRPGSPGWRIDRSAGRALEGYASRTSVRPGEPITLYVSSAADSFDVAVYRMGWYGGTGARKVWESISVAGIEQPVPSPQPETNTIQARWKPTLRVPVGDDWTTGAYLAKLTAPDGKASYVPFTVREGGHRAPIVFQSSVTTWQAYNSWGGFSLYIGRGPDGGQALKYRSPIVSFDRPYSFGSGAADFLGLEYPLLTWLEERGYDVSYVTNIDLHTDATLLTGRKAFLSLGHDEYWSTPMREHVERAIADGVNLAFFGANSIFRHIRLEDSPLGPARREVNYRSRSKDPVAVADPTQATVDWRNPPLSKPEDAILGAMYECNPVKGDLKVYDPLPWLFAGTGLERGDTLKGLLGSEYDRVFDTTTRPQRIWVLFRSPVRCLDTESVQDTTFARFDSGAAVFNAATSRFLCVFSGCGDEFVDRRMQRMVANLLDHYLGSVAASPEPTPRPFAVKGRATPAAGSRASPSPRPVRAPTPGPS